MVSAALGADGRPGELLNFEHFHAHTGIFSQGIALVFQNYRAGGPVGAECYMRPWSDPSSPGVVTDWVFLRESDPLRPVSRGMGLCSLFSLIIVFEPDFWELDQER